jgi:aryl-alcohol dehydrogenase-like predicted oxidoreductase
MVSTTDEEKPKMVYRNLGRTGLKVSVLGYGNWLNSDSQEAYETTRDCIKACKEAGVNFFDTAEVYGAGEAERQMGRAFKELDYRREDLVVTTKLMKCGTGVNDKMLSRKHIMEGMAHSLERLQMDYVDVVYCHRPDIETPLEETCRAMHDLIESGRAFYWGTSEWSAVRIQSAIGICARYGWHAPVVEQPQYSMLCRDRFE